MIELNWIKTELGIYHADYPEDTPKYSFNVYNELRNTKEWHVSIATPRKRYNYLQLSLAEAKRMCSVWLELKGKHNANS